MSKILKSPLLLPLIALAFSLFVAFKVNMAHADDNSANMPKRPNVAQAADVQPQAPAAQPQFVPKVIMVIALVDKATDEVKGQIGPVVFPDMATCNDIANAELGKYIPVPPPGHRVYVKCINPSDVST